MSVKRSRIFILIVLLIIISAVVFLFVKPYFTHLLKPEYVKVKHGSVEVTISAEGELVSKNFVVVNASPIFKAKSDVVGQLRIRSIVPEGKQVRAGEEIAQLDRQSILQAVQSLANEANSLRDQALKATSDTASQLRDLRYGLSQLKINMEISQINMEQSLYDPPAAQRKTKLEFEKSKISYDQANQSYLQKKLQIEASIVDLRQRADASLKKQTDIQRLLGATSVRAPRAGVIAYYTDAMGHKRGVGSVLTPEDLAVATMPDVSSLVSQCLLSEDDLGKVKISQPVTVKVKILDNEEFKGVVSEISAIPALIKGKKFYNVNIRITSNMSPLKPLMTTFNDIHITTYPDVLYLPKVAVFSEGGKFFVYTRDFRKQEVKVGGHNSELIAIMKGANLDEEVFYNEPTNKRKFKQVNL